MVLGGDWRELLDRRGNDNPSRNENRGELGGRGGEHCERRVSQRFLDLAAAHHRSSGLLMANMDGVSHGGMTATIVMATYNGRQFLREQLDSIVSQVRQADEVVIVDDCSSDGTPEYIDAYINEHGLKDTWRIYRNEKNLGFVGNYLKGCSLATGDVIFFSDQDDVWADGKISEMMAVFERHEDALVVSCDTTIIDQDDRSDNTFQTSLRRTKEGVWKVDFGQQVSSMLSSGLTLGVKRSFMDEMTPIIEREDLVYDSPLGLFAAAKGGFYRVGGEALVLHRVHRSNASAPTYSLKSRLTNPEQHIKGRKHQLKHIEACRKYCANELDSGTLDRLDEEIAAREVAIKSMEERKPLPLIAQLIKKGPMANDKISLVNLIVALRRR